LHEVYDGLKAYEQGVGTEFRSPLDNKVVGGITGYGGESRVESMYAKFRARWEAGDREVDIIGFSRGAALAREFANLLHERGYRPETGRREWWRRGRKKTVKCPVEIRFLGIFDTVGSFGRPGNNINLGVRLNVPPNVKKVAHAVARDEKRSLFPVTLLNEPRAGQEFQELVFPGDHSDIGGGWGGDRNMLSDAPLRFVWREGRAVGVPFGLLPGRELKYSYEPHDKAWTFGNIAGSLLFGNPYDAFVPIQPRELTIGPTM
jgi:uncharacterized protein (DUF2235 family)